MTFRFLSFFLITAGMSVWAQSDAAQPVAFRVPKGQLSGRLFDTAGKPLAGWRVDASPRSYHHGRLAIGANGSFEMVYTQADGSFLLEELAEGDYVLRAESGRLASDATVPVYFPGVPDLDDASTLRVAAGANSNPLDFRVAVRRVSAKPCFALRGKITLDGLPYEPANRSDEPISLPHWSGHSTVYLHPRGKGIFDEECAHSGLYDLHTPLPGGIYVKEIRLNGRATTGEPIDVPAAQTNFLEIVLVSKAAKVVGRIRATEGKVHPGLQVTLWQPATAFTRTTSTSPDGSFEFDHLPPGEYRIAGWEGLHAQAPGWGIQTVPEFRKAFEFAATSVLAGEGQRVSVQPIVFPRIKIEETARKLKLTAGMNAIAELKTISEAVKSPKALVRFLEVNRRIDWRLLRDALGLGETAHWMPPCGQPIHAFPCSVTVETLADPDQAILIVQAGDDPHVHEYIRFLRDPNGSWRAAGANNCYSKYGSISHRIEQRWNKPFLTITSDRSETGVAVEQTLEEWFDLTRPDLTPAFSFTPDGQQSSFGFEYGRSIRSTYKLSQASGREQIELTLHLAFEGVGLKQEAEAIGFYERTARGEEFRLRRVSLLRRPEVEFSIEDFESLADPFQKPSKEKFLRYAQPGLRAVAQSSDSEAREWLQRILNSADDTEEKRLLMRLLSMR